MHVNAAETEASAGWLETGSRSLLFPVVSPNIFFYFSFVSFSTQLNGQQQQLLANENECGKIFFVSFVRGICFLNVFLFLEAAGSSAERIFFPELTLEAFVLFPPFSSSSPSRLRCLLNRIINVNLFPIIIIKKA
jgi:hypothetical protein